MAESKIEWTDATWNPVRGCSLVSPGCANCYAMKQAHRFSAPGKAYAGLTVLGNHGPRWTGEVRTAPEMLGQPLRWRRPRRVFVNSMSDLFHDDVPNEYIAAVFGVMAACPEHTFQVLTKRAERMAEWFDWAANLHVGSSKDDAQRAPGRACGLMAASELGKSGQTGDALSADLMSMGARWPLPNVWIGVSVEDQERADERIPHLLKVPAAVRFVSAEPLLGPVELRPAWNRGLPWLRSDGISWVIPGGESGPKARPCDVTWVRSLVRQCRLAGVAPFVKQLGARPFIGAAAESKSFEGKVGGARVSMRMASFSSSMPLALNDPKGGDPAEWPEDLRVREWPEVRS